MCVFITAVPLTKLFARGLGGSGGHVLRETTSRGLCVLAQLLRSVCVFITAVPITKLFASVCVYYCSTYYKAVRGGGGGGMEDMCYERLRAEADVN